MTGSPRRSIGATFFRRSGVHAETIESGGPEESQLRAPTERVGVCAEGNVVAALGADPADVTFTSAVRPRTGAEVPICASCQATYSPTQFPADVAVQPGGAWGR